MAIDIRPYAGADHQAVVDVMVRTGMFSPEDAPFLGDALAKHLASAPEESRCLVAHEHDHLVGVALARAEEATDRVWDITMLGVRPDQQHRGIGRSLMGTMQSTLLHEGARMILVRTSSTEQFAAARAFYGRLGYERVARIADYWTDGDDLVVFRHADAQI